MKNKKIIKKLANNEKVKKEIYKSLLNHLEEEDDKKIYNEKCYIIEGISVKIFELKR